MHPSAERLTRGELDLAIFALPKAFRGHTGIIQENALSSWVGLPQRFPIYLLGDDEGTAELASAYGVGHISGLASSDAGVPLVSSILRRAREEIDAEFLCYINADIVLLDDFAEAMQRLSQEIAASQKILVTAQRAHLQQPDGIDLTQDAARRSFSQRVDRQAVWDHRGALDLFLYNRDLYQDVPPLVIGRGAWDTWLLWKAVQESAQVIDASPMMKLIHQAHDYGHLNGGWQEVWANPDARNNALLAKDKMMTLDQAASHSLTPDGLVEGLLPDRCDPLALARFQMREGIAAAHKGLGRMANDLCSEALQRRGHFIPRDRRWAVDLPVLADGIASSCAGIREDEEEEREQAVQDQLSATFLDFLQNEVIAKGRSIAVWGGGQGGRGLCALFQRHSIQPRCVIDSDPQKAGQDLEGIPIQLPENLSMKSVGEEVTSSRDFVVIASIFAGEISEQLLDLGFHPDHDFTR